MYVWCVCWGQLLREVVVPHDSGCDDVESVWSVYVCGAVEVVGGVV